jgi:uncharacterized protein (DUF433 family)
MLKDYVENVDGEFRVAGSVISLDSIVCAFWDRRSPEAIAADFPALTLEQVYGALAFYFVNQAEFDDYIDQRLAHLEARTRAARPAEPAPG